ncbi:MAG: hypothetical protein KME64_44470 [Scytonematopsis contorta HA4267-MV1]|nr:hypothetical protein [Scytonematopsis contorta HA4267-MV1]
MNNNTDTPDSTLGCLFLIFIFMGFLSPSYWILAFAVWAIERVVSYSPNSSTSIENSDNDTYTTIDYERQVSPRVINYSKTQNTNNYLTATAVPDDLENILQDISNGEIKDPITQEIFTPGETIYLCHHHRIGYHEDSWKEVGNQCIVCGSSVHSKRYTLPLSNKSNKTESVNYNITTNIPLIIPLATNINQEIIISETYNNDIRDYSYSPENWELVDNEISELENLNHYFYESIIRLTELPILELSLIENIFRVVLIEKRATGYFSIYESEISGNSPFSGIRLRQSPDNPFEHQISLAIAPDFQISISEAMAHFGDNDVSVAYDNTGRDTFTSFIKKIANYKVVFRIFIGQGANISSVAIYPNPTRSR